MKEKDVCDDDRPLLAEAAKSNLPPSKPKKHRQDNKIAPLEMEEEEGAPLDGEALAKYMRKPFDPARFSAGVVKLYEAVLKEPIPEEMMRLIAELDKKKVR